MPVDKITFLLKDANFFQKENTQKVVLIGDSHAEALEFHLNEEIKKNDLILHRFSTALYLKNFNFSNKKTGKIFDDLNVPANHKPLVL